jgi:hypothetical protein
MNKESKERENVRGLNPGIVEIEIDSAVEKTLVIVLNGLVINALFSTLTFGIGASDAIKLGLRIIKKPQVQKISLQTLMIGDVQNAITLIMLEEQSVIDVFNLKIND